MTESLPSNVVSATPPGDAPPRILVFKAEAPRWNPYQHLWMYRLLFTTRQFKPRRWSLFNNSSKDYCLLDGARIPAPLDLRETWPNQWDLPAWGSGAAGADFFAEAFTELAPGTHHEIVFTGPVAALLKIDVPPSLRR